MTDQKNEAVKVGARHARSPATFTCSLGDAHSCLPLAPQVFVRCRPLSDQERRDGRQHAVVVDGRDGQVTVREWVVALPSGLLSQPPAPTANWCLGCRSGAPPRERRRLRLTRCGGACGRRQQERRRQEPAQWGALRQQLTASQTALLCLTAVHGIAAFSGCPLSPAMPTACRGTPLRRSPTVCRCPAFSLQAFGPDSRQEDVYAAAAAPLVEAALQGFSATVFAYGQTGCGKTHTMEGREQPAEERGVIPPAFDHIFREIQKGKGGGDGGSSSCSCSWG